jgi:hypothetical protein
MELMRATKKETKMMSIFELEFLIHCYISQDPFIEADHQILDSFQRELVRSGILLEHETIPNVFELTERGRVWIDHILSTPFPMKERTVVESWVRGNTNGK